ncbi:outer membrane lipid asymmetry maintenance protein MlaD [Rickettsiella grylli]|uniref:outer membrane lipid asymmetry maintenance protein MlaD n=1 Tax=Rickettsiella grylli TaxID=59196 RepID=UPI0008FD1E6D|nr:outer membrane lipid asymmetry maintenance protein MlaD [Rickettsiella grylli]
MRERVIEIWVGFFMLFGVLALLFLGFKVSGLSSTIGRVGYNVTAAFDNIGGLKMRSPVSLAGVHVGEVSAIKLDDLKFKAIVTMRIDSRYKQLPIDTSASILTQGLLGANYINLTPGFAHKFLNNNDIIQDTHPALILEDLIGQFLFSLKNSGGKK